MNINVDQQRMDAHAQLTLLRKVIARISPEDNELIRLDEMLEKVKSHPYSLAVVGEFNRGKSSLINALLGMPVLPADVTPTTATINRVVYADSPYAKLCMHDGSEEQIPIPMLKARITKLSEEALAASRHVREAVIGYPTVFCKGNISILDTPGLNESQDMDDLTLSYIQHVDAVVFLINALVPYSISEAKSVCKLLRHQNIRHILFTVNFIDRVQDAPGNEERCIASVRKRITKTTFPLIDANDDLPPEEKERQKRLISDAAVIGVSAKKALDAFVSGSMEDLDLSRIETYKTELMTRLIAQQNDWLKQDILPYLRETATVFNSAVQRRVSALENQIAVSESLITQAQQQLSSLLADETAIVNVWVAQVRNELCAKTELEEMLASAIRQKLTEGESSQTAPSNTPLADAFYSGTDKGGSVMRWLKKKVTEAGIYRNEQDADLQRLKSGYEYAKEDVLRTWLDSLQYSASEAFHAAFDRRSELFGKVNESIIAAADALETKVNLPSLPTAHTSQIQLIDEASIRELRELSFPLWASVDTVEHVVPRLATRLSGAFIEKISKGTEAVRRTEFPDCSSFCTLQNQNITTLVTIHEQLKQSLVNLKSEAVSLLQLLEDTEMTSSQSAVESDGSLS